MSVEALYKQSKSRAIHLRQRAVAAPALAQYNKANGSAPLELPSSVIHQQTDSLIESVIIIILEREILISS